MKQRHSLGHSKSMGKFKNSAFTTMSDRTNNIPDLSKRMQQLQMMNRNPTYQNLKIDNKQLYSMNCISC